MVLTKLRQREESSFVGGVLKTEGWVHVLLCCMCFVLKGRHCPIDGHYVSGAIVSQPVSIWQFATWLPISMIDF